MGKKTEKDNYQEFYEEMEGLDNPEEEPATPEEEEKNEVEEFMEITNQRLESCHKGILTNQKYVKKVWERLKVLEDNFKLLYEENKK